MPRPSITSIYTRAQSDLLIIEGFYRQSKALPANMQGFVAEVLMLRAFSVLEKAIIGVACRVACGVNYRNGVVPNPICVAKSCADAIVKFKNYNRNKPLQNLSFTSVGHIGQSVKFVINATEPFRVNLCNYGNQLDEMRRVRNHIAHRTNNTRAEYKQVLFRRYGANLKLLPAAFLTSTKRQNRAIIEEYLITIKVILDDITRG